MTLRHDKRPKGTAAKRKSSPISFIAISIVVSLGFLSWRFRFLYTTKPSIADHGMKPAAAERHPEFQKLLGRWRRLDGGYVMAIHAIADNGAADAAYFNPYPIHVGNAVVSLDGGVTKLFVELRDANYPGSTYTLTYDPESDQLKGIYYQAVERQSFSVEFVRVN